MAAADPLQVPGTNRPAAPGSESRCHDCLLTATGVVHDARGCVLVCADHKRARQQQSMISGHRNCPLYYPDDGPLWRDADFDAELAEDRRVIAARSTSGAVRWDGGTLVEADHDSAVGISIDQAAGNPNAPFIVSAWTRLPRARRADRPAVCWTGRRRLADGEAAMPPCSLATCTGWPPELGAARAACGCGRRGQGPQRRCRARVLSSGTILSGTQESEG